MKRIKTSTKIFLGLAAAAVTVCVVNAFVGAVRYKKYDVEAKRIVAQLDNGPIRVLDIELAPTVTPDSRGMLLSYLGSQEKSRHDDTRQRLNIEARMLEGISVEGETLRMANFDSGVRWLWRMFDSPSLETAIVRQKGEPDEVIDMRQAPEAEEAPAAEGTPVQDGAPAPNRAAVERATIPVHKAE